MSWVDQVSALVAAGVPEVAGISPAELAAHAAVLPEVSGAVLAVHPSLVGAGQLAGLLRHGSRPGFVVADMTDVDDFAPISGLAIPDLPLYLVFGATRGDELRNAKSVEALAAIRGAGRTPLTLNEGISWLMQDPMVLQPRGVLHDDRVAQAHPSGAGRWSVPGDLDQPRHRARRTDATQRAEDGLVLGR